MLSFPHLFLQLFSEGIKTFSKDLRGRNAEHLMAGLTPSPAVRGSRLKRKAGGVWKEEGAEARSSYSHDTHDTHDLV